MRKTILLSSIGLCLLASSPAIAERIPRSGKADARIKTLTYHENDVYRLRGAYGYTTTIEFSEKEQIETISLGDSEAWQVIPGSRKNLIYIKPLEQNAETNMTVLTSKRIYTFELAAAKASSPKAGDLTFRVKFRYPEEETLELANFGSKAAGRYDPMQGADASNWNFDYSYAGPNSLRPKRVYDDGTFTYFEFKKPGMTPAIFSVDEEGNESIVNYNTEGSYMIVNSVGQQFTLRDGNAATCIFNDAFPKDKGKQSRPVPIAELQEKKVKTAKATKAAKASPVASKAPDAIEQDALASSEKPGFFSYWHGKETTTLNN